MNSFYTKNAMSNETLVSRNRVNGVMNQNSGIPVLGVASLSFR